MTSTLIEKIEEKKVYHKKEIDNYEEQIRKFRKENRGKHEGCDWILYRKEMSTGHRMAWEALNDLLREKS